MQQGFAINQHSLQPEVNKGLQAHEAFISIKQGDGNGAEAPEPLPPEGGTPAKAASRNIDL